MMVQVMTVYVSFKPYQLYPSLKHRDVPFYDSCETIGGGGGGVNDIFDRIEEG